MQWMRTQYLSRASRTMERGPMPSSGWVIHPDLPQKDTSYHIQKTSLEGKLIFSNQQVIIIAFA